MLSLPKANVKKFPLVRSERMSIDTVMVLRPSKNAMAKISPPQVIRGIPLGQTGIRKSHGITVTAYKTLAEQWPNADNQTVVNEGDTILIVGPTAQVEAFAQLR